MSKLGVLETKLPVGCLRLILRGATSVLYFSVLCTLAMEKTVFDSKSKCIQIGVSALRNCFLNQHFLLEHLFLCDGLCCETQAITGPEATCIPSLMK